MSLYMYLPLRLCQIHVNLVSGKEKLRASAVAMLKASSGKTSAIARSTVSPVGALVGDDLVRVRRFASGIVTRHDLPHTPRTPPPESVGSRSFLYLYVEQSPPNLSIHRTR